MTEPEDLEKKVQIALAKADLAHAIKEFDRCRRGVQEAMRALKRAEREVEKAQLALKAHEREP
jgi:exonuclease VII small subunit